MNTAPSTPDADVIYDLYKGDYKVQLVRIALRLDVFSALAAGATDAETVARALAERLHLLPQVTFLPADLHAVQFGAYQYDVALLGQITHHLTPVQNQTLFHQIFHTLVPGGLLVIDVPLRAETGPPSEEVSLLNVALGAISGGLCIQSLTTATGCNKAALAR